MRRFKRGVARGTCAVAAAWFTAMPAAAASSDPPTAAAPAQHLNTTLSAGTLKSLAPTAVRHQDPGPGDATSFFKTKKGAAVLVLMGAGLGYTLYAKYHDRVKSPIRYP